MTHILTLKLLIDKGASFHDLEQFAELFPNGAPLTVQTFVNIAGDFDWSCAAQLLLRPRNQVKFKKLAAHARATYADRADFNFDCAAVFATLYINQESQKS